MDGTFSRVYIENLAIMTDFYLTLPSNASMSYYPDNSLSEYTVKLPRQLQLDDSWQVGLCQITYPGLLHNILETYPAFMYTRDAGQTGANRAGRESAENITNSVERLENTVDTDWHVKYFTPGFYSLSDILQALNDVFINDTKNSVSFTYNKGLQRTMFKGWKNNVGALKINDKLAKMMGFREAKYIFCERKKIVADFDANASIFSPKYLYIYTDIVEPQFVGDRNVPLLRTVPINATEKSRVMEKIFTHPYYVPLLKHDIETIQILIKTETGESVPFERGLLSVTLHFRKRY